MMSTGHLVVELTAELLAVGQRRRTQRRRVPAGLREATRAPQLDTAGGCGGCFFAVLFISSVDVMQNCEGSLSRDKFLF
jgi:hypothetical protein